MQIGLVYILEQLRRYEPEAEEEFLEFLYRAEQESIDLNYAVTTVPTLLGLATILTAWKIPVQLLKAALCTAVTRNIDSDFIREEIIPKYREVARELVRFNYYLAVLRKAEDRTALDLSQFEIIWTPEFYLLFTAVFYETLRAGAFSSDATDKEMLAFQYHKIFEPLVADRFGIWTLRREMRDLAYRCEDASGFNRSLQYLSREGHRIESLIQQVKEKVKKTAFEIEKPIRDIYPDHARPYKIGRLLNRSNRLSPSDCVSFVLIFDQDDDCHNFLKVLYSIGNPNNNITKDYLQYPKKNGYRSLHVNIDVAGLGSLRFYLRTEPLHRACQQGILYRWQEDRQLDFTREDLLAKPTQGYIFVYSKDGKVHLLPDGSSPLDLAYKLSEEVGHGFERARIIGRRGYVQVDHQVENRDIVFIFQSPRYGPHIDWVKKVKIPEAREAIDHWFRTTKDRSEIRRQIEREKENHEIRDYSGALILPPIFRDRRIRFCQRCRPYPPGPIVGYRTMSGTVTIHRADCSIASRTIVAMPISWRESHFVPGENTIEVDAWDRIGLLRDLTTAISNSEINISEIEGQVQSNGTTSFSFHLLERDSALIDRLEDGLRKIRSVVSVRRTNLTPQPIIGAHSTLQISGLENPYSPRPVRNGGVFFGRANELREIQTMLAGLGRNNSVILWGQQRIGKTSLLLQLGRLYRDSSGVQVPVHLNFQGKDSSDSDPQAWIRWFGERLSSELGRIHPEAPKWVNLESSTLGEALNAYVDDVVAFLAGSQLVILLDETQNMFEHASIGSGPLLQCLDYLMDQHSRLSFVFSGWGLTDDYEDIPENTEIFAKSYLQLLDVLDEGAAEELIRKPVMPFILYEDGVVESILAMTRCHPLYIHRLCSSMVKEVISNPEAYRRKLSMLDFEKAVNELVGKNTSLANFSNLVGEIPYDGEVLKAIAQHQEVSEYISLEQIKRTLKTSGIPEQRILLTITALNRLSVIEKKASEEAYRIFLPLLRDWFVYNPG